MAGHRFLSKLSEVTALKVEQVVKFPWVQQIHYDSSSIIILHAHTSRRAKFHVPLGHVMSFPIAQHKVGHHLARGIDSCQWRLERLELSDTTFRRLPLCGHTAFGESENGIVGLDAQQFHLSHCCFHSTPLVHQTAPRQNS